MTTTTLRLVLACVYRSCLQCRVEQSLLCGLFRDRQMLSGYVYVALVYHQNRIRLNGQDALLVFGRKNA